MFADLVDLHDVGVLQARASASASAGPAPAPPAERRRGYLRSHVLQRLLPAVLVIADLKLILA